MNKLENFLSRLQKVKKTGNNSWIACCSAHEDKSPSLSVSVGDDERILVHCFAGCGIDAIAGAIGFSVSDLMPDKKPDEVRNARRIPFSPSDVLACTKNDAALIYVVMCDLDKGKELTEKQIKDAKKASARIYSAANMGGANNG